MMRFQDKVALVTGASEGIGLATAQIMAREGATVVMVARNASRLEAAVQAIVASGGRAFAQAGDATVAADVDAIVAETRQAYGKVDILVNGVGGSTVVSNPAMMIDEMALAEWQRLISFNLDPLFLFCHAVIPAMKQQRSGKIVNLASISGRGIGGIASAAYTAAKGGVIAITRKLAYELGPWNINVNATAPGFTLTERMRPTWDRMGEQAQAALRGRIPLGRVSTAEDQARVICFLCSSDADFLSGLTLDVTGGQ